ncbi:MAG: helix-turn-helix domain-containing protein [Anaerolineales bacterium]|nr:helix-turn-helix domain-containing protein [Anaerolineales bacterium]
MTDTQALTLRAKMLGAMIRKARTAARLSLSEAAEKIGTTKGILSSYEHGRRVISLPELELLAYQLDIPLEHFTAMSIADTEDESGFETEAVVTLRQRMIGAMLRKRRSETGVSLKALAEAVGLSSRRLSTYERGDKPIPLTELELIVDALGQSIEDYIDTDGPVGEWVITKKAFEQFMQFPPEMREFLSKPGNQAYLQLAKQLSEIPVEKLRLLAETLLDLTL